MTEAWSPDQFWEYATGLTDSFVVEQLHDTMKERGVCLIPAQGVPDPAAQFVMWAMLEGSWQGADIDGGAAQDKAVALGLIVQTEYDPAKHGENAYCEPGDRWYVPSEKLLAALGTSAVSSTSSGGGK